jgi:hypothetical protein
MDVMVPMFPDKTAQGKVVIQEPEAPSTASMPRCSYNRDPPRCPRAGLPSYNPLAPHAHSNTPADICVL